MATTQHPAVTLTRAHRDAVWEDAANLLRSDDVRNVFPRGEEARDEIASVLACLGACVRVLDQIGWNEHDPRDSYPLEVDSEIAAFMGGVAERAQRALESDLRTGREELCADAEARRFLDLDLAALDAARLALEAVAAISGGGDA